MNSLSDQQLLRDYTGGRSEAAFAELVRRHVDLVYSAALRMVCDPHLAEDVTQGVFVALARNAEQLTDRPVLSGWLHRTAQNLAVKVVRTDVRRRAREQEAAAMNELLAHESDAVWEHIAPHLDAALGELSDADHDALLMRYFERKSAHEMAQTLGISDEAAQKRVNRAVERLREFFAKRGVTVGTSGLVVVISVNAVQVAPVGLAVTISTAAALAGTTIATTATATATKAIAMTTLQKTLIAATVVAAVGTGIYEARQASTLRTQVQSLQQQTPTANQIQQVILERDENAQKLAALRAENDRLSGNTAELLKLRGEITRLKADSQELARLKTVERQKPNDPMESAAKALLGKITFLKQRQEQMPHLKIPELQYLNDRTWAHIANDHPLETDDEIRQALCSLRDMAKQSFAPRMGKALIAFIVENNGQLPSDVLQLKPYFESPVEDALLQRYELLHTGKLSDLPTTEPLVAEKAPVDEKYESLYKIGVSGYSHEGIGLSHSGGHGTWATKDIERVKPFTKQN